MNRKSKKNAPTFATQAMPLTTGETSTRYHTLILAVISLTLLWISFPPVGAWWLGWLAPVPMIWLVVAPELPSDKPFRELWYAGMLYWLATFYFIPIPHWALWFGWIAVCLYMSIYTPLFVAISRTMVHRYRIHAVLVVPIVWTGIEWIRCNFATGMAMACLSHTQFKQPLLIQVSDLSGAYTLTFAMAMFAAGVGVATFVRLNRRKSRGSELAIVSRLAAALTSLFVLGIVIGYGQYRLNESFETGEQKINVVLVQSSIDVVFEDISLEEKTRRFEHYCELTLKARSNWSDLDLIVWPESSFPTADLLSDFDDTQTAARFEAAITDAWSIATGYPDPYSTSVPLLASALTLDPASTDDVFNSAVMIREPGVVTDRYYKSHRVMFGEYIPFADWFPILKEATPLGSGLAAGTEFTSMELKGVKICPTVCFETTVPHLIRRMIRELGRDGHEPDALVNLTNDGWFFGTSCLDLHLACNVFRAVEMRKTHLVCANTGLSAEIDSCGRLLQVGPRRDVGLIRAEVSAVKRNSPYRAIGDLIPMIFGFGCLLVLVVTRLGSRRAKPLAGEATR